MGQVASRIQEVCPTCGNRSINNVNRSSVSLDQPIMGQAGEDGAANSTTHHKGAAAADIIDNHVNANSNLGRIVIQRNESDRTCTLACGRIPNCKLTRIHAAA